MTTFTVPCRDARTKDYVVKVPAKSMDEAVRLAEGQGHHLRTDELAAFAAAQPTPAEGSVAIDPTRAVRNGVLQAVAIVAAVVLGLGLLSAMISGAI